jgi:hypothetical protein
MLGADFVHCADVMILALPKTNVTDYTEKPPLAYKHANQSMIGEL